jgi:methyltransferase
MELSFPALGLMAFIISQRLVELWWANRNTKRLISLGGKEYSPKHYSLIVALHTTWIVAILVLIFQNPSVEISAIFLTFFAVLTAFRAWILVTLGSYFTTKIISLPGAPLRKTGPYRFIKHPNYALVVCEIFVVPMIFGFWQIAAIWGLLNIGILAFRIHEEDLALRERRETAS